MADVRIVLAAASLSVGGCAALFRLRKQRKTEGAVKPVACGMLAAVFFTGLAVPGVNSLIGYKELCTAAQMEAERHGTQRFYTWNVKRSENMDVYLKQDVIKLNNEDITRDSLPRGVLMMRGKDADRLPPVLKRQERIENVTGRKAVMRMESMQPGDMQCTYADISRIGRECG